MDLIYSKESDSIPNKEDGTFALASTRTKFSFRSSKIWFTLSKSFSLGTDSEDSIKLLIVAAALHAKQMQTYVSNTDWQILSQEFISLLMMSWSKLKTANASLAFPDFWHTLPQ